jgi:pimeloyl-ACP methyl ester carboxylesterase
MKRVAFLAAAGGAVALAATRASGASAESDIALDTPTGSIAGTLLLPASKSTSLPTVLLIAGSGPTDRDGNNPLLPGKNDALKLLAEALGARGVVSVRYDKRGIAASKAAGRLERDLRFDAYVEDAVGWIRLLRAKRPSSHVVVAGHSEGALIGTVAARRAPVDALVTLEGAGLPAAAVLRKQLRGKLPPDIFARADQILADLEASRTVSTVPDSLQPLFHESVQPYLISWFKYDPAAELAAVRAPITIVQGSADVQVSNADADVLSKAAPSARRVNVDGMNHVLKHAPDTSSQEAILRGYTDPSLPVEPAVVDAIAAAATKD